MRSNLGSMGLARGGTGFYEYYRQFYGATGATARVGGPMLWPTGGAMLFAGIGNTFASTAVAVALSGSFRSDTISITGTAHTNRTRLYLLCSPGSSANLNANRLAGICVGPVLNDTALYVDSDTTRNCVKLCIDNTNQWRLIIVSGGVIVEDVYVATYTGNFTFLELDIRNGKGTRVVVDNVAYQSNKQPAANDTYALCFGFGQGSRTAGGSVAIRGGMWEMII